MMHGPIHIKNYINTFTCFRLVAGNIYHLWDVVDVLGSGMLRNDWTSTGETDETGKVIMNYLNF